MEVSRDNDEYRSTFIWIALDPGCGKNGNFFILVFSQHKDLVSSAVRLLQCGH
jgi:hypothetical protein